MSDLRPEEVREATFRQSLRGFDRQQVKALLADLADRIGHLQAERDALAARLGEEGEHNFKEEFQALSSQIGEILESARQAADEMRERAATDATRWRAQAQSDSEQLRGDAWEASSSLVDQSVSGAKEIVASADREALARLGLAEREAHRLAAETRREADQLLRSARMEASRQSTISSQPEPDEPTEISAGNAPPEDEPDKETSEAVVTLSRGESGGRRRRSPRLRGVSPDIRLVDDADASAGDREWAAGKTIRVIPGVGASEKASAASDSQVSGESIEPQPTASAVGSPNDDVAALFASLRSEGTGRPSKPVELDGAGVRDGILLPITNRVLRNVKRQLTEAQNVALERLRVAKKWDPELADLTERLQPDLVVLGQEAFAAGYTAVEQFIGESAGRAKPRAGDLADTGPVFAGSLAESLEEAMSKDAGGPKARAALASRVFRAWRTDEAERRVRHDALVAYHKGLSRALASLGVEKYEWQLAGTGCKKCQAASAAGEVAVGKPFPGAKGLAPVHKGCECTIVPVIG